MERSSQAGAALGADASLPFTAGPVLLLGAPGVGKGTQAQLLMGIFGIPQISTGDLLRHHVSEGTKLGKLAKDIMESGLLVPDDLVNGMVASRLTAPDTAAGYILDGFPRTEEQASWLDAALPEFRQLLPLVAIQISVDAKDLLKRITGRRTCPTCRRIYNIYSHAPQHAGFCDLDGTPLMHRADDTVDAFRERLIEYHAKTGPTIDHYRRQGRFREVDGTGTLQDVAQRIFKTLRDLRA